jgi:hypothetical protein
MKGQILVFEQVLLFSVGVIIFITCYALFAAYQSHFLSTTLDDQLDAVKNYVFSNIVEVCKQDGVNSSIIVKIPKTINNKYYRITLSNANLNVSIIETGEYKTSSFYKLNESFKFSGEIDSAKEKIIIYKIGNSIIIK